MVGFSGGEDEGGCRGREKARESFHKGVITVIVDGGCVNKLTSIHTMLSQVWAS